MSHASFRGQSRLPVYRAQRVLGPILVVSGLVIAIGGWFETDYAPSRFLAVFNSGMVPILLGILTYTVGYTGERIIELKRRIAQLEAEQRQ
ncbi:MAG TPA: hypothetical protein VHB99_12505 [Pirellulales bacterium]|nr:hypothetical protein [Pirellulales bacterium]